MHNYNATYNRVKQAMAVINIISELLHVLQCPKKVTLEYSVDF